MTEDAKGVLFVTILLKQLSQTLAGSLHGEREGKGSSSVNRQRTSKHMHNRQRAIIHFCNNVPHFLDFPRRGQPLYSG